MLTSCGIDRDQYSDDIGINGYESESPAASFESSWLESFHGSPTPSTLPILKPSVYTCCSKRSAISALGPYTGDGNPGSSKRMALPSHGMEDEHGQLCFTFNHITKNRMKHLYYLLHSLTDRQRHDVRSIGFGGLLEMDILNLSTEMNSWLVEGFNPVTRQFYVNGRPAYVVSAQDVAGIFDLNFNPAEDILEDDSDPQVQAILTGWKVCYDIPETATICLSEIELVTSMLEGGGPNFKRLFVLYVLHSFLTPSNSSVIRVGLLKSLINVDDIGSLNWAGFVLNELCGSIESYREKGSPIGPSGCILILMIIYFHRCPLQGMPEPVEVPFIQHWSSYAIEHIIREETLGGGFGKAKFQESFKWPANYGEGCGQSHAVVQTISFEVANQIPDDLDLALRCNSELDRSVATIVRDLNVVLLTHVDRNHWLREYLVSIGGGLSLIYMSLVGACPIQECLREVVENVSQVVRFIQIRRLSDEATTATDAAAVSINDDLNCNGQPNASLGDVDKVYASQLVSTYAKMNPALSLNEIEVADYCIADFNISKEREPLFHDGMCCWLLRMDMRTFNSGVQISPVVITAWARLMNSKWTEDGRQKAACLAVVRNAGPELRKILMVENWKEWLGRIMVDLTTAELIFVPIMMRGHYFLLVLNFKTRKALCIDDIVHEDQQEWDRASKIVVSCVCELLRKLGDDRAEKPRDFTYEAINPHWSTRGAESDCGLAIMHIIDSYSTYRGNLLGMNLHKADFKLRLRVSYCARIVLDKLNIYRPTVLSLAHRFVEEKGKSD